MQTQVFTALSKIVGEDRSSYNEAIIVNCSMAIAFLSAYSTDPKQMQALFTGYDETEEPLVMMPIKLGVLINGNPKIEQVDKLTE